ncbi:MAG: alpha/beta hydrolase [Clostridia bacterium]|nr:alpha/beta hydrolase [Clostridia bacterium]
MGKWIIIGSVLIFILLFVLTVSYVCFVRIFYASRRGKVKEKTKITAPVVDGFAPFRPQIGEWMREVEGMDARDMEITSFDGLRLRGYYYEYEKGAPIEIMFHGYRGNAKRDLCGGVIRAFKQGRSVLIVNHRASGESEGRVVTFGINESRDCLAWVDCVTREIDSDARIILTGISMGAATVMIAAGSDELPKNVVAVLADCGYTSAEEIIKNTMRNMKLPPRLLYPFARLGGRLFGGFDIDETSPIESLKKSKVPVIFIHGDADGFVPYDMSVRNFEACSSEKKKLVAIRGAGHGVAYPTDPDTYLSEIGAFFDEILEN